MRQVHKIVQRLLLWSIIVVAFSSSGFALNPADFRKILGVNIKDLRNPTGRFTIVRQRLGDAEQVDTGDAAGYEGRITYTLHDRSQYIVFSVGECHEGYTLLQTADPSRITPPTVLKPSFTEIYAGGLELGMEKKDVELLFAETLSGGWKLEKEEEESDTYRISFQKNITSNNGLPFCDHIWMTLKYDTHSKLSLITVVSGGCHDSACED